MSGETNLARLLQSMTPQLNPGQYVFCCVPAEYDCSGLQPIASLRESEGLSLVLPREVADAYNLSYDYVAAWITLEVHSSLAAVGLTASFSTALAQAGISCNVVAGFHHDHLFVPCERAEKALSTLCALSAASLPEHA
ncbi:acetyltransferase [Ectopseudomonas mendocina]|uniref:Acetyltransferase n=1 Tax=Ectopseudomonas mendocina S5.2 TaxID=1225174 RepID=A0ABN4IX56_ECTME|nr:ACT domain-containing protein [Pseudomonas mendocina]ALN20420.1 acetyltransferase [Pseudomonas mendocina S5.2]KER98668.1 acetyltransferase [Pseudomonas mendocina]SUD65538.1 acetyltransferase [Pseudomonas mendocina]